MKTLVTGGAGFIGSHLVKKLVEKGEKVIVIDDLSSGSLENLFNLGLKPSDFEFKKIDLTDYHQTLESLKNGDIVFHLAARIGGIKFLHGSKEAELSALQENLVIDANVFRACLEERVKKIIYPSSSAVYPLDKQYSFGTVFSEDDFILESIGKEPRFGFKISINPDGGYGLAKLLSEIQLNLMKDMKVGIARIFNVYGENEPFGERAHAILEFIQKAINYPKENIVIWGDGKQARDYLYVSDCVDGLIKIEEKISEISPLTINIGSGCPKSLQEIAAEVIKISKKNIKPSYGLKGPVGPLSRTADIRKAERLLGWQPKVTLDEGLEKTYFWVQKKLK